MKHLVLKLRSVFILLLCTVFIFIIRPHSLDSAPPTNVSDTLSSSQLSYFARMNTGVTTGDTLIKIKLGASYPSNSTANIFVGDTIAIGIAVSGQTIYTVRDIATTASFEISPILAANNAFDDAYIVATRSAIHTVTFTPKSSAAGGAWQFLIKASSRRVGVTEFHNDGMPDQQGFDLGADVGSTTTGAGTRIKAADITCPFGVGVGATASNIGTTAVVNGSSYHIIDCQLPPSIGHSIDVGASFVVGRALSSGSQLINPAPAYNHTPGLANSTADVYTFLIRHLDSSRVVLDADTISGKIAVVESVRVTATVDPTISFQIGASNVTTGQSRCGVTLGADAANTTATSVAFGSLNLAAFNDLAQSITCTTNADNGFIVQVYESDFMKNINSGTTIPNTRCDASNCTTASHTNWSTANTTSYFGYSLENIAGSTTPFTYNNGGTFMARPFGVGPAQATTILSNAVTPNGNISAYICYRITVSNYQEAGNYETHLIYTATASF